MNNNNSTDLSRFNDKYLKCIVTKRKSSMAILKDHGAVIIYQNSGYNHLYLGNEFIAAGWGFKSKEELIKAEKIITSYDSDIQALNDSIDDINENLDQLNKAVKDLNDKINPIVYIEDENGEKVELNEVFFRGVPAFYKDAEITSIEKVIVYNNNQIIKINDDTNIIELPLGSKIEQISYNISCKINDCGGIKEVNWSFFESSNNSINNVVSPISVDSLQWANLEPNKTISLVHRFYPAFKVDKDEDLKVINNVMISFNGTVKEQYKKYPELTLSNEKFTIYSLENILNEHTITLDPLIIRPIPEIRWYMTTDATTYTENSVKTTMESYWESYELKGAVTFNDFKLGEFKDVFIPIYKPNIKIIDLFIPQSFELHELRYVNSTSEYNWTGATGVLTKDTNNYDIVLRNEAQMYIRYNLYQIRITPKLTAKIIDEITRNYGDNAEAKIEEFKNLRLKPDINSLPETGRLMLRLYIKKAHFSNDIYNSSDGVSSTFTEPEIWDLLYNEDFRRNHWISYNDSIDNLKDYLDSSIYAY
jgi:hypothetical protein